MAAERRRKAALTPVKVNGRGHVPDRVIPVAPDDLGAPGRVLWETVWALSRVEGCDVSTVERLARLEDQAADLRAAVAEDGAVLRRPIQNSKGEVIGQDVHTHPALFALRRIDTASRELGAELGLSPEARRRMGIDVAREPEGPDALDELRETRALRRHRAMNGDAS